MEIENFTSKELKFLHRLNTPQKIQDYLNKIPFNFEEKGETLMSPRRVMRAGKAHCMEGALLASAALWINNGEKPLLLDLRADKKDFDHVVALFRRFGNWGAVSKTNHAVLRYREPVYQTIRELALSYFHEYFLNDNGKKTLRDYSEPFDLRRFGRKWLTNKEDMWFVSEALDKSPHKKLLNPKILRNLRSADAIEIRAGEIIEWKKNGKRVIINRT